MTAQAFSPDDSVGPTTLRIPVAPAKVSLHVESGTGGDLALHLPAPRDCSSVDRDAVLRRLHEERRGLVARMRAGALPQPEVDYLRDIEREIDRLELAEERARAEDHPAWPRLEKLLERVLDLQAKYGENVPQVKP
jgi:hypothetical protein